MAKLFSPCRESNVGHRARSLSLTELFRNLVFTVKRILYSCGMEDMSSYSQEYANGPHLSLVYIFKKLMCLRKTDFNVIPLINARVNKLVPCACHIYL